MKPCKILVVEDDINLAFLLRQRLEAEGYEVATAHSAAEGFSTYLGFSPDLLLTDITMGEEDGLYLARRVRSHNSKVRTVYMTADPGRYRTELDKERKTYQVEVLEKPFNGRKLVDVISHRTDCARSVAA